MTLRRKIAELQEYRRMGISTLADVDRYEKEKIARARPIPPS
jgi:transcriptional adapter 2-alpha